MTETVGTEPARPRDVAVSVQDLSKTYPVSFPRLKKLFRRKPKPPVEALRDVSFEINRGEVFGLIGPNGAGKTTLVKIIATLVQPTTGKILVEGLDSVRQDQQVRQKVGLAGAEERSFYWRLTAEHNLLFFARLYGLSSSVARERIQQLFELFDIGDVAHRRFAELSTGSKQRLSIARAMLAHPPLLLLDEPTRSLDPIAAARVRETIKSLTQDNNHRRTVFLTSHNLAEVEELCDRVAIISQGRIHAIDSPKNLKTSHTQSEHVSIFFTANSASEIEESLRLKFTDHFLTLGRSSGQNEWQLRFSRAIDDESLDQALRIVQSAGGVIRSIDIERASLLDVLETYDQARVKEAQRS